MMSGMLTRRSLGGDTSYRFDLQTYPDTRYLAISAKIPEFSNKDKTLVVQYSIKL